MEASLNLLLLHLVVLLVFPPLLLGIIGKTKAFFAGRWGPPLLQPYYDIFKLLQKSAVYSVTTNWMFRLAPLMAAACVLAAGMILPIAAWSAPLPFQADFILFIYLLALARFLMILASLDTGSSFEGMGANREGTFACFSEISIFLNLIVLVLVSKSLSLSGIFLGGVASSWIVAGPILILVIVSFFLGLLVENSRIPVDDPETHLELTMIHEVMVLDHSGPELGLIFYGQALKFFIFSSMLLAMIIPFKGKHILSETLFFALGMVVLSVLVGVIESTMARLRLNRVLYLLYSAFIFSVFGFIVILVRGHA